MLQPFCYFVVENDVFLWYNKMNDFLIYLRKDFLYDQT